MSISTKCTRPLLAWYDGTTVSFKQEFAPFVKINLPCNKCIGCRLRYAKEWAIRCMHEAHSDFNERNSFITLTYNNEHLPEDGSLNVQHFQKFMKRLRKKIKIPIRFYHCGEYGEKFKRPHYHALIFGYDFPDKVKHYEHKQDKSLNLYTSKELSELWPFGFNIIGNVTFESASYCARYITKKINGEKAKDHYNGLKPEYCTMSKGDGKTTFGLGYEWYEKYGWTDCHANDRLVVNGYFNKIPRYYDLLLKRKDPELYDLIKKKRKEHQSEIYEDSPDFNSRARQEEAAKLRRYSKLRRKFEQPLTDK